GFGPQGQLRNATEGISYRANANSPSEFLRVSLRSGGMAAGKLHPLLTGTAITSAGTLVSRVLGLVRDMGTASLFGLAAGGVLDALVVAFRIPNLFRALFGEGALTASYLPVFSKVLEDDRPQAWQVFRATNFWLAGVLFAITAVGEAGIGIW